MTDQPATIEVWAEESGVRLCAERVAGGVQFTIQTSAGAVAATVTDYRVQRLAALIPSGATDRDHELLAALKGIVAAYAEERDDAHAYEAALAAIASADASAVDQEKPIMDQCTGPFSDAFDCPVHTPLKRGKAAPLLDDEAVDELARDLAFAIDVTEPTEVIVARFTDTIRAALSAHSMPSPVDPPRAVSPDQQAVIEEVRGYAKAVVCGGRPISVARVMMWADRLAALSQPEQQEPR